MIPPIEKIHKQVLEIVYKVNEKLKKAFQEDVKLEWKEGVQMSTSALTKTDLEIDSFLRKELHKILPVAGFITEELDDEVKEYNFIIDPIDGTNNFAHKIPIFGTSIALWKRQEPLYGIISFPLLNEIVWAIKEQGLYLNGKKIKNKSNHKSNLFSVTSMVGSYEEKLKIYAKIKDLIPFPYSFQSCTFVMAMTALYRMDISFFVNMAMWDIAAGLVMVQEAGLEPQYISQKPIPGKTNNYEISFVLGEEKLAKKVAERLKNIV